MTSWNINMGARKRFDKKLFEENDPKARAIAKKFFGTDSLVLEDNPNRYGPDLMQIENGEHIGFVECEVKLVWKEEEP